MDKKDLTKKERLTRYVAIMKLFILIAMIISASYLIYRYYPDLIDKFQNIEELEQFILQYKAFGIVIYLVLQVVQIVISVLPGQILQFAAGYIYGFLPGVILSLIGIALGTVTTFYLARILGKDAMHVIFGEERITKYIQTLNSKRSYTIMFVFFAIPGIPKDILTYAAGVSELKLMPFLLISLAGRTPALIGSIAMSRLLYNGSYIELVILSVITVFLFAFCIIKREALFRIGNKLYDRMIHARW